MSPRFCRRRRCCRLWRKAPSALPAAATMPRRATLLQALNDDRHRHRRLPASAPSLESSTGPAGRRSPVSPRSLTALLRFRGLVLNPEGTEWHEIEKAARPEDAAGIGAELRPRAARACRPEFPRKPHGSLIVMRLLVTRPEPDATRQAERLAARGHEPVLAPLLAHRAGNRNVPLELDGAQALIVTSRNALRALASHRDLASGAAASALCRRRSHRESRDGARFHQGDRRSRNGRRIVAPDRRHARAKGRRARASCRRDGRLRLEIGAASQRLHASGNLSFIGRFRRPGCPRACCPC